MNLAEIAADRTITAAQSAAGDLFYLFDISADGVNRSKAMTRAEAEKMFARYLAPMAAAGDLVDEASYGYFKARLACKLVGLDYTLGDLPVGGDLTFDLTKGGAEQGKVVTIAPADNPFGQLIFPAAITLAAGDVVRIKIKSTGPTAPGAYLNANLILEPASG